ncbi:hypothetical protein DBR06_SOUSAS310015, partial [Sousa chinensis]
EELEMIMESQVKVQDLNEEDHLVVIRLTPRYLNCYLVTLTGLCLRVKLECSLSFKSTMEIYIAEGTHSKE